MKTSQWVTLALLALAVAHPVPASASGPQPKPFKIYYIYFNSPGKDNGSNKSLNGEYICIQNTSDKAVNLKGWTVKDSDGNSYTFKYYKLGPGQVITLHTGSGKKKTLHRYWGLDHYVWDNDADTAYLKKPNGTQFDKCHYAGKGPDIFC